MQKYFLLSVLIVGAIVQLNGQQTSKASTTSNELSAQKKIYLGIGSASASFQNTKSSNDIFKGLGLGILLGVSKETSKTYWDLDLRALQSSIASSVHKGEGRNINVDIGFRYLRKLNSSFAVGGKLGFMNASITTLESLGNNANHAFLNSSLSGLVRYQRSISNDLAFDITLDIGLLAAVKEFASFTYSAPQGVLEDGEFDFQNKAVTNPYSFQFYSLSGIGQFNKFSTNIGLHYKERWGLFYSWAMCNYTTIKNYPFTSGHHAIGLRFNFISK